MNNYYAAKREDEYRAYSVLERLGGSEFIEKTKGDYLDWLEKTDPERLKKCYNEIFNDDNPASHPELFEDFLAAIINAFTNTNYNVFVHRYKNYIDHIEVIRGDERYCRYILCTHYKLDPSTIGDSDLALERIATQCCIDLTNLQAYQGYSPSSTFAKLARDPNIDYCKALPGTTTFANSSFYSGYKGSNSSDAFKDRAFRYYRDKENKVQVGYLKINFPEKAESAMARALGSSDGLEFRKRIAFDYFTNKDEAERNIYGFLGYRYQINPLDTTDKAIYLERVL